MCIDDARKQKPPACGAVLMGMPDHRCRMERGHGGHHTDGVAEWVNPFGEERPAAPKSEP